MQLGLLVSLLALSVLGVYAELTGHCDVVHYYQPSDIADVEVIEPGLQTACIEFEVSLAKIKACADIDTDKPEAKIKLSICALGKCLDFVDLVINRERPCVGVGPSIKFLTIRVDMCLDFDRACVNIKAKVVFFNGGGEVEKSICWGGYMASHAVAASAGTVAVAATGEYCECFNEWGGKCHVKSDHCADGKQVTCIWNGPNCSCACKAAQSTA